MPATVVVGQPDFTSKDENQGGSVSANGLSYPDGVLIIGDKLVVSDCSNHRVLIYNQVPTSNGALADVVIGQPNKTSSSANQGLSNPTAYTLNCPGELGTDGTKLFITDYSNARVLIYNQLPTSDNASADVEIGAADMTHVGGNAPNAFFFYHPNGVSYDPGTGKLFIACGGANNFVYIYNTVPTANNAPANVVVGQPDFATKTPGNTAAKMNSPTSVHVINGKLLVTDTINHRVLIFNSIPTSNGASADLVIGQTNLTNNSDNQGGSTAANTLSYPADLTYNGRYLMVTDDGNNRIVFYEGIPTTNNASAVLVLGQPDLQGNGYNQNGNAASNTIGDPFGGIVLYGSRIILGDSSNNRVLIYYDPPVVAQAMAPTCGTPPPKAPDLFQIDATKNTATLYFTSAKPATYHLVSFATNETAEQFGGQWEVGSFDGIGRYTVNLLKPNTSYYFKVRGGNGCATGEWSRIMKVKTAGSTNLGGIVYYAYSSVKQYVSTLKLLGNVF